MTANYNRKLDRYECYSSQAGGMVPYPENHQLQPEQELQQWKEQGLYCGRCKTADCDHLIAAGQHYENPWIESRDATPTPEFEFEQVEEPEEEDPFEHFNYENQQSRRKPRVGSYADRPVRPR